MEYATLFQTTLNNLGFDLTASWNAFGPEYNVQTGWPVRLPDFKIHSRSLLLLHFQDFVTIQDGRVLELEQIEKHYGHRCSQILVTHMHPGLEQVYTGPINLIEFSSHNWREVNQLNNNIDRWMPALEKTSQYTWQCLNGVTRDHRRRVAEILKQWPNGALSLATDIPLKQWDYSTYRGTENIDNFVRLGSIYGSCPVNIVTETVYETYPGLLSEKILYCFAAQQIPVVIGSAGLVESCRQHGFDMFDDLVDTSYDRLPNDIRLDQALELNKDLILGKVNLDPYQGRLIQQREFLLSQYQTVMANNFRTKCAELATKLLVL